MVEDAVVTYADNLCHSEKAIRVPTLRILCHYEPLTYEDSTMDQPPEKKMKTETGVPHACPVDIHGCNVCMVRFFSWLQFVTILYLRYYSLIFLKISGYSASPLH